MASDIDEGRIVEAVEAEYLAALAQHAAAATVTWSRAVPVT